VIRKPLIGAAVAVLVVAAAASAVALAGRGPHLSARDRHWRQDVAYLARELPQAHIHGLTGVSQRAWNAAAHQLER